MPFRVSVEIFWFCFLNFESKIGIREWITKRKILLKLKMSCVAIYHIFWQPSIAQDYIKGVEMPIFQSIFRIYIYSINRERRMKCFPKKYWCSIILVYFSGRIQMNIINYCLRIVIYRMTSALDWYLLEKIWKTILKSSIIEYFRKFSLLLITFEVMNSIIPTIRFQKKT